VDNPVFVDDKKTRRQDQQTLHEAYQLLIKYLKTIGSKMIADRFYKNDRYSFSKSSK